MIIHIQQPKLMREALCQAQSALIQQPMCLSGHIDQLQRLINEIDFQRPLGPDGTHGNRHTATCGCEDK